MTNQVIPTEAIEAIARGMWIRDELDDKWEDLHEKYQEYLRENARAALEAAAPHIAAAAWDEGKAAGFPECCRRAVGP